MSVEYPAQKTLDARESCWHCGEWQVARLERMWVNLYPREGCVEEGVSRKVPLCPDCVEVVFAGVTKIEGSVIA